jgi:hypothetical protein|tara:strand:- start:946 stop:1305 length:360 start_codon:yes stop_codon:yes gene_type:complete
MAKWASGKYALSISDRSGMQFPYLEMVKEWNGALVHISEYEPKQPQLDPPYIGADPIALQHPRPSHKSGIIASLEPQLWWAINSPSSGTYSMAPPETANEANKKRLARLYLGTVTVAIT